MVVLAAAAVGGRRGGGELRKGGCLSALVVLFGAALALNASAEDAGRDPRIYVYDLPGSSSPANLGEWCTMPPSARLPWGQGAMGCLLTNQLKKSKYYEPDASKADYFWIPGGGMYKSREVIIELFDHIRTQYPYWNETAARGEPRHILLFLYDNGAGECFRWPENNDPAIPADINPASPSRNVIYLTFNGMRDGAFVGGKKCSNCLQPGKDIMLPTRHFATCGPLCGYSLETLRNRSIWGKSYEGQSMDQIFEKKRKHKCFFGGLIDEAKLTDYTGRGGFKYFYANDTEFHLTEKGKRVPFEEAMLDSDFCYSPMGGHGGDTDRYVAGMMFGCIPVMLNSSHHVWAVPHSLPLEEAVPWHEFSTLADTHSLNTLSDQITCLRKSHIMQLREGIKRWWHSMMWSSTYGSYFGESGEDDAFNTLMKVLGSRVPYGYKPSPETVALMSHPGTKFPCRTDSPGGTGVHY